MSTIFEHEIAPFKITHHKHEADIKHLLLNICSEAKQILLAFNANPCDFDVENCITQAEELVYNKPINGGINMEKSWLMV
jgi:hypothetical protein